MSEGSTGLPQKNGATATPIDNLRPERVLLQHMKRHVRAPSYEDERRFFAEATTKPRIIEEIKKHIHVKENILEDLERIGKVDKNSAECALLRERVIGALSMRTKKIKRYLL